MIDLKAIRARYEDGMPGMGDVPALLARVEELEAVNKAARALIKRWKSSGMEWGPLSVALREVVEAAK